VLAGVRNATGAAPTLAMARAVGTSTAVGTAQAIATDGALRPYYFTVPGGETVDSIMLVTSGAATGEISVYVADGSAPYAFSDVQQIAAAMYRSLWRISDLAIESNRRAAATGLRNIFINGNLDAARPSPTLAAASSAATIVTTADTVFTSRGIGRTYEAAFATDFIPTLRWRPQYRGLYFYASVIVQDPLTPTTGGEFWDTTQLTVETRLGATIIGAVNVTKRTVVIDANHKKYITVGQIADQDADAIAMRGRFQSGVNVKHAGGFVFAMSSQPISIDENVVLEQAWGLYDAAPENVRLDLELVKTQQTADQATAASFRQASTKLALRAGTFLNAIRNRFTRTTAPASNFQFQAGQGTAVTCSG
jgi:hypothetical protein